MPRNSPGPRHFSSFPFNIFNRLTFTSGLICPKWLPQSQALFLCSRKEKEEGQRQVLLEAKRGDGWSQCVDDLRSPVQEEFGLHGERKTRHDLPCASERSSGNLQEGLLEWDPRVCLGGSGSVPAARPPWCGNQPCFQKADSGPKAWPCRASVTFSYRSPTRRAAFGDQLDYLFGHSSDSPLAAVPPSPASPQSDFKEDLLDKEWNPTPVFLTGESHENKPFLRCQKKILRSTQVIRGSELLTETEKIVLEAGNGLPSWKFNDQLFPCDVCGKVFGRQQTLSRHLSLHTEERKYKCHLCPYAAKCRANLNQHLTVHSVKLVSTDAEDIVSAVTSEGSDGKKHPYYYSCHVCGFETELNVQFVSHMSLHVDKEQWMFSICCTACDFVTMEEAEIKTHISSKHTGEDRKTPSESNSPSSSSLSALSDSANSKDDSDSSQKNKSGNNLLVISVMPGSQPSLNSEEKPEKGFECVFCNFVCKTKNMFERHLQIHLITRMFECDVCHKFMKTPEQLLEHKKCHTVPTGGL
ncbi:hypothetical protein FD754_004118, partial [Muntiacus muntjak]